MIHTLDQILKKLPLRTCVLFLAVGCLAPGNVAHAQATLTDIEAVKAGYVKANGGTESLEAVQSLRVFGTMEEIKKESRFEIALVKKRPHFKRIIWRQATKDLTMAYNGRQSWRMVEVLGRPVAFSYLEGDEAAEFESDGAFDSPLVAPDPEVEVRLAAPERIGRVEYYVGEGRRGGREDWTQIRLDPKTFWEHLSRTYTTAEGESVVIEAHFFDYEKVGGLWVAQRVERFRNGEPVSILRLEGSEINPGVFDSFFDPPEKGLDLKAGG